MSQFAQGNVLTGKTSANENVDTIFSTGEKSRMTVQNADTILSPQLKLIYGLSQPSNFKPSTFILAIYVRKSQYL